MTLYKTGRFLREKLVWYVVLCGWGLLVLIPFYVTLITPFKSPRATATSLLALPTELYFRNFVDIFERANVLQMIFNSAYITVTSTTILALVLIPMVSYAIARNSHRPYYKACYFYLVLAIYIPLFAALIPIVVLMGQLGLHNRIGIIILYCSVSYPFGVYVVTSYIQQSVPLSVEESAILDGATTVTIFFRIVLPMIKPIVATMVIINGLEIWNKFLLPLVLLSHNNDFWTLPIFQMAFKQQYYVQTNLAFAAYLISIVPALLVFLYLQKHIIKGVASGALK